MVNTYRHIDYDLRCLSPSFDLPYLSKVNFRGLGAQVYDSNLNGTVERPVSVFRKRRL